MVTVTKGKRFAVLGFSGVYTGRLHDAQYNQQKTIAITDRPVYRPGDKVQFTAWVRRAQYDMENVVSIANQKFTLLIRNGKNEEVFEREFVTDAYGGLSGELQLPHDANLGVYRVMFRNGAQLGTFRVEEYKKQN